MKKIMFDFTCFNKTQLFLFSDLGVPLPLVLNQPRISVPGVISSQQYKQAVVLRDYEADGYFSSKEAIHAMQGTVEENERIEKFHIFTLTYSKSLQLDKFDRMFQEQTLTAVRTIKQEWLQRSSARIKNAFQDTTDGKYDITLRNGYQYEHTPSNIRSLLERVNHMMSTVLVGSVRKALRDYTNFISELCRYEVNIQSIQDISVSLPDDSIYRVKVLPPIVIIFLRVTEDKRCLNQIDVDKANNEIAAWKKTAEAAEGNPCPIKPVPEIIGYTLEYNYTPDELKKSVLDVFDSTLTEFSEVVHIEKSVMERIFFPKPRYIRSVSPEEEDVVHMRNLLREKIDLVTAPLMKYLKLFKQYEGFINVDVEKYVAEKVSLQFKDPENTEIEVPVTVNLQQVRSLLAHHLKEIETIEKYLPVNPLECGMFLIQVQSVRDILVEKHRAIIKLILSNHTKYCKENVQYLDREFQKIMHELSKEPENIEELTDLQEYMSGLNNTMMPLTNAIKDMMDYGSILDEQKFRVDFEDALEKWTVYGGPKKVAEKCEEVVLKLETVKVKYNEDMRSEQNEFKNTLVSVEADVAALVNFKELSAVHEAAAQVKVVEERLQNAQEKIKLYNSRELLFEQELTDYEDFGRVQKLFDPYAALWGTASEWVSLFDVWMKGLFVDLNAEEVEQKVDRYYNAINKASKYFVKMELVEQVNIVDTIKNQVNAFRPEVPLIVSLRNPGMRERHWAQLVDTLKVDLLPIDEKTTEQILAFNMKDKMDLIEKVGESAAKEYQIEQALDKMEKEWESIDLQIAPYKETGTGVLKGIDDLNTVLDEQITMAQTIMFSAFKGPFEERIEDWNRKLCCISDLLEVWVAVQRNWLYLQPIFESADINRQLPVEGKKFSIVDKNWRSALASAKAHPKAIEFCDNEKLLEKFKDSNVLLDQVQKGLSDYLETKRGVFARFYFLSADELLSILSESKDVKLVQPHLKKCFEAIDKVKFLEDLKIDRMISPEGEEVMLKEMIDPVEKNVEYWMLELEAAMRESVKEVMRLAIEDYLVTPRPQWMQKWPSMCVLNGSQMHWTSEMENLFANEGVKGPQIMYDQQVAQLADMTILVRGELSKAARNVIGALTVIDVHARDVIKKLVDENVDTPHNFGWTSQLRYYWDGDLKGSMVAATRYFIVVLIIF